MELRGKQKSYLRSKAHHLTPIFQIGKGGLNEQIVRQVGEALEKRELIKINLLQNTDETVEIVATEMEQELNCLVVQIIGRVLVLYKPSSQEKYRRISTTIPR
ncbi:ribosome assembly RNA-binding protein YhbY [Isobaculum melis]|uniref:RNA-binding protein n=1 Tax=Isobaculum melis TaxID=142588 RepID=A0A1H9T7K6_9LACT|nr:ribosome assembly RNA-binding protein YhbY [Isobaculum melis]SER93202.1 RNA-binding protein [Isobaculum melis]